MRRLLLPLCFLAAPALAAPPFQDTAAIDRAVMSFTGRPVGAEGGARAPVDTRLRLSACSTVSLSWRTELRDAVVVTCTDPQWRLFVPIVAVPGAPAAGKPIAEAPAKPVIVIKRGDPVTIAAGSPGFSITRDGIALGDAAVGARFLVKVEDNRPPVQAVAVDAGRATLPGWTE